MVLEELLESHLYKYKDILIVLDELRELTELNCVLCEEEILIPIFDPVGKGPYCCQECMETDHYILSRQVKEIEKRENQIYNYM